MQARHGLVGLKRIVLAHFANKVGTILVPDVVHDMDTVAGVMKDAGSLPVAAEVSEVHGMQWNHERQK